jgi:hypothetical protein
MFCIQMQELRSIRCTTMYCMYTLPVTLILVACGSNYPLLVMNSGACSEVFFRFLLPFKSVKGIKFQDTLPQEK